MQKRLTLINLIENEGYGVTQAARKVRIKVPTAKAILYLYRNKKRIFSKRNKASIRSRTLENKAPEVEVENPS